VPVFQAPGTFFGRVTADVYLQTANAIAYSASLSLDVSLRNDFQIGVLTGNLSVTFTNPSVGRQGFVWVRQDATGSRTVSFAASGYTVLKDVSLVDVNPQAAANSVTVYTYTMVSLGGTDYLVITKTFLA